MQPSTDRFHYLAKTLSRTNRKDYENYIINAVWHRLGDRSIKPTSQWHVRNPEGWHLIDLYFPQINFGVECDEGHHKQTRASDEAREITLIEVLSADNKYPYTPFHIDVTMPHDQIERRIDECVETINQLVKTRREAGDLAEWLDRTPSEYFKHQQVVSTHDDILFPTIVSTVNALMQSDAKAYQQGYFTPKGLDPAYKFWFPQLEVAGKAQARGWHNSLSQDGQVITEYNTVIKNNPPNEEYRATREFLDYKRVVFAKVQDPVTNVRAYKFVGVFRLHDITKDGVRTYHKIADEFDVSTHRKGA